MKPGHMSEIEQIKHLADQEHDAMLHPLPTVIVRSLRSDPNYTKCPRCWHYPPVLLNYDGLCDRCCTDIPEGVAGSRERAIHPGLT